MDFQDNIMIPTDARMLCLYLNASHRWHGKPLYRAVVEAARTRHLAGAAVFLVDLSYGTDHRLRDAQSEYLSFDIPVVVDIVDAPDRIDALIAELGEMLTDGLMTVEPVRVVAYTHHEEAKAPREIGDASPVMPEEEPPMPLDGEAQRVTVYLGSSDTWQGHNLATAIVDRCRQMGIAGATASLGVLGYGKHSRIHRPHLFALSQEVPEKVEIIDRPERIAALLPILEQMVEGGLIIVQDVRAVCPAHRTGTP